MPDSGENNCIPVGNMCLTKVNFRTCTYLWAIENFTSVHEKRKRILKSLPFSAIDDEFKWILHLNPNYCNRTGTNWISLHVHPADECYNFTEHSPIMGSLKFSVLDAENKKEYTPQNVEFSLVMNSDSASNTTFAGFSEFIKKASLLEGNLLSQDRLTIYCEISYVKETDIIFISGEQYPKWSREEEPACLKDIEALLMNKQFSDVTLAVKNKKYPAHKSILASRSPVFKAMLSHDLKDTQSNCIELKDIDLPAFEEMLRYIYTGTVNNLETLAPELLGASDRYDIKNLKAICENELYEKLSQETAVNVLMLADLYNAEKLKKQTLLYMKIHSYTSNMLQEEVRKTMVKSFPHLLLEIIDTFGKQNPM